MKTSNKIYVCCFLLGLMVPTLSMATENPDELYRQGRFAEAEKAYAAKDMDHPKDIRYRYNRGCAAYQNSDYRAAQAAFSSVIRRTGAKVLHSRQHRDEIHFNAAYNLGNTAFKQGDFESAVACYKQAILLNPENKEAKYNLELALRKLEKRKKNKSPKANSSPQNDSARSGNKEDQSEAGDKDQDQDKLSKDKNRENNKGKTESREPEEPAQAETGGDADREDQLNAHRDHSGALNPLRAMPDQKQENKLNRNRSLLDRKKAEALLDNLTEDRSKFFRFQIPENKKHGVQSGKDW